MAEMDKGNRQAPAASASLDAGVSLDVSLGGRELIENVFSFAKHALLEGAEIVEAIRTGGAIIARTAPGTEAPYGREQDESPGTGYVGGAKGHVSHGSHALRLSAAESEDMSQGVSGATVSRGNLRFGSSAPEATTEVHGSEEDSVAVGRIYPAARRVA
jgi:hypothetical protein